MLVLTAVGVGDAVDDAVGTGVLRRSRQCHHCRGGSEHDGDEGGLREEHS